MFAASYILPNKKLTTINFAIEVRPYILVNHWGTVICKEPIEMTDIGCKFVEEGDYRYMGETCKLTEYM